MEVKKRMGQWEKEDSIIIKSKVLILSALIVRRLRRRLPLKKRIPRYYCCYYWNQRFIFKGWGDEWLGCMDGPTYASCSQQLESTHKYCPYVPNSFQLCSIIETFLKKQIYTCTSILTRLRFPGKKQKQGPTRSGTSLGNRQIVSFKSRSFFVLRDRAREREREDGDGGGGDGGGGGGEAGDGGGRRRQWAQLPCAPVDASTLLLFRRPWT